MPTRNAKPRKVPTYRERAGYGQAIVTLTDAESGKRRDYWLGTFNSRESRERYHRVIADWEANGRRLPAPIENPTRRKSHRDSSDATIVEIVHAYWRWAKDYYRPKHVQALRGALSLLRQFYGRTPAIEFGPKKLRGLREEMIRGDMPNRIPWSRKYINAQVQRIRHVFKWAAARERVPVSVFESLRTLEPLRRGKCSARETDRVKPAPEELIDAVRPLLSRPVRALVELQLLTGARPGELLGLRASDIEMDRGSAVWKYRPEAHKNTHRDIERIIYFGPQSQIVLREFISDRATDAYLFSPKEAETEHRARRRALRRTPMSCGNRVGTNRRDVVTRQPGARYTTSSYQRAIQYACERAFPPPCHLGKLPKETAAAWRRRLVAEDLWPELIAWRRAHRFHPHQLRHNCASRLRKLHGLEASSLVLGHASAKLTDAVYAERDQTRIVQVVRQYG